MKINQDSIENITSSQDNIMMSKNSKSSNLGLYTVLALVGALVIAAIIIIPIALTRGKDNKKQTLPYGNSTSLDDDDDDSIPFETTIGGTKVNFTTKNLINSTKTYDSGEFISNDNDTTVFLVTDGGVLNLNGVTITKTDSTSRRLQGGQPAPNNDADKYSFYGINSAIVVLGTGKAYLNGVKINTNSYGSNAVVATNGGTVDIKNSVISTTKDSSRGIHATYNGSITADNVTISTKGGSCANIATDRGEGTIVATNMKLSTEGSGSPLIYSTGDITVSKSSGSSTGAQIVVVEGKNSVKLTNCIFNGTGIGNRNNVDKCGVMIYQSMSGDADTGKGTFECYDSNLTIINSNIYSSTPMFFVTNTEAIIILRNTITSYGSGVFLNSSGTSEWGNSGSNGGKVTLNVTGSTINGTIYADNTSSIVFNHDSYISDSDLNLTGNVTTNIIESNPSSTSNKIYSTTIGGTALNYTTKNLINSTVTYNSGEFIASDNDTTVFLVTDGGVLNLNGVTITKNNSSSRRRLQSNPPDGPPGNQSQLPDKPGNGTGNGNNGQQGQSNDADKYSFYGINSAIVVLGTGKAYLNGVKINTNSYGSNAVVATNGGTVDIKNSVISTTKDSSRGIHATYKGNITADNVTISTKGGSCANIATDRGEGTIVATNMKLSTEGSGSPLIYSTGDITVSKSSGSSTGAQIVVVEGKNSVKLTNCIFNATGIGNRNNVDKCGVMIYQSMSGDADTGKGTFECYNSSLTVINSENYNSTPMFFVTNTEANIDLNSTITSFGSGIFLNASGTGEWGHSGSNGGNVTLTLTNVNVTGSKIHADNSSIVYYSNNNITNSDFTM